MKAQPPANAPQKPAQVGEVNADLDRERSWQRLADRDRLAHLVFRQPSAFVRQFAPHLTDQRDRAAKAKEAEAKKVTDDLDDPIARSFRGACHCQHGAVRT
jgi:hypothetical protein